MRQGEGGGDTTPEADVSPMVVAPWTERMRGQDVRERADRGKKRRRGVIGNTNRELALPVGSGGGRGRDGYDSGGPRHGDLGAIEGDLAVLYVPGDSGLHHRQHATSPFVCLRRSMPPRTAPFLSCSAPKGHPLELAATPTLLVVVV